ncbi:uncharacterized protein ACA1_253170 [Acanthamoeba castellanii str. Neff]|uniref:Uncharacterized protein n=1 Tax=Acanthamoeba castellanii (strain ATCC 30010 / Neff) TaxID=1257118 RepID=L8HD68_ACACF|nr:uncharacterized protein ACA1_253170 [Acanthamoeba castellanii str. Neff]ELR22341.1 hypothetical protein ACA1_253170 [Acanthamoeba castellanii str. Neff]
MEGGVEYVQVRSDEINNNNVQTASTSPYRYTDLSTNLPLERPSAVQPGCDMCFQRFGTFSLLYKHRARPCFEDGVTQPPFPHPVKIAFHRDHLLYIGDIVHALNLPLQDDEEREGWVWVVVDRSMFEITMRRFYVGQVTKYNLEQWYHPLDAKATAQGAHHKGFTMKTLFLALSDDELKLLQGLASVVLARNLGMGGRETQKELTGRELLEDKITPQGQCGDRHQRRHDSRAEAPCQKRRAAGAQWRRGDQLADKKPADLLGHLHVLPIPCTRFVVGRDVPDPAGVDGQDAAGPRVPVFRAQQAHHRHLAIPLLLPL